MKIPHVKDRYYVTHGIFYLLGILTFIPMYFVITANRYWMFRFRYIGHRPSSTDSDEPSLGPPGERNILQASFSSAHYIVSHLSLIVSILLTAAYSRKLPSPEIRITAALLCTLVFYLVHFTFCFLRTDSFQVPFFFVMMAIACFLGVCGAVIIVSLFEMVTKFPIEYYVAILTAQAVCGVISAVIQIIIISVASFPTTGGKIVFGIGTTIVSITLVVYNYLKRNSQYFIYKVGNDPVAESVESNERFLYRIWTAIKLAPKNVKMYMTSLVVVCGTTAIVYPGFTSLVASEKSTGKTKDLWIEIYFVPVITFLTANLCDLVGRLLAHKIRKPRKEMIILTLAIVRIIFIPLMFFCNAQPRLRIPVFFYDVSYIVFTILFSLSNGYLVNLCLIIVPTRVETESEKPIITVITVLAGVLSTAVFSFFGLMLIHIL